MSWPALIAISLEWAWLLLGTSCLLASALLALRPTFFSRFEAWSLSTRGRPNSSRFAFIALGLLLPLWIALFKLAQLESFQLLWDSGVMGNLAWNAAHGFGLHSSVIGDRSYLSVHFAFTVALLSPILWLWNSLAGIAMIQGAAVGLSILGAWLLTREITKHPATPWLIAILALSQHFFHDLIGAVIDNSVFAAPLFIWAAYCWKSRRKRTAVILACLMLTTREEAPFIIFGLGLYLLAQSKGRDWRRACALMAGSVMLFLIEVAVIYHAQSHAAGSIDYWGLYGSLGDGPGSIIKLTYSRPWRLAAALVYPPSKLQTIGRVLLSMGLLPLGAGAIFLMALVAWLPHQLADAGTGFQQLNAHTCAFVFGPLIWASACGLQRLFEKMPPPRRHLPAVWVLCVSGVMLIRWSKFLLPAGLIPANWAVSGPRALTQIPPDAKVWCDEFFLPQLGLRRYVKTLPRSLPDDSFEAGLFLPGRVLLSLNWGRLADPASRARILGFLNRRHYKILFQEHDLVVLGPPPQHD